MFCRYLFHQFDNVLTLELAVLCQDAQPLEVDTLSQSLKKHRVQEEMRLL